ncbi:MAG: LamG domain-containing protein [Planctomycetota bacterium]
MTVYRYLDFEPPGWGELATPPTDWPTYAQRLLALNPLAYWRLNDAPDQSAIDATGNLTPGTYAPSVLRQQPGALAYDADRAVTMDGVTGAINFLNTTLLNGATQGSILFWMNYHAPAVEADGGVIARWANTGASSRFGWMVWVDKVAGISGRQRTLSFAVNTLAGDAGRIEGDTGLITPGVWDAYAATFTGGQELRLYKNGQLVGQKTTNEPSFISTNQPLRLGRTGGTIGHLPAGLDEVAVFDVALDAEAIQTLYEAGVGRLRLPEAGSPV